MDTNKRIKSWPHWRLGNCIVYLSAMVIYAANMALLFTCKDVRYVLIFLTVNAALATGGLVFTTIHFKDRLEALKEHYEET